MKAIGQGGSPPSFPEDGGRISPWISITNAVGRWVSLVLQVAVYEFDARFGSTRFGILIAVAEPYLLVLFIIFIRGIFHGYHPPFGMSAAVFYSSGVVPYYVFMRLATRSQRAAHGRGRRLPGVTRTIALMGTTLSETALTLSSLMIWFVALYLYGLHEAAPFHVGSCLAAIAGLWLIGFGFGLCNAVVGQYVPLWSAFYRRIRHPLMLFSGVFFIADLLPLYMRNVAVWNPLVHGIEWFRWGLYGNYPIATLEIDYFLECAVGIVFVGVILFWSNIRSGR